MNRATPKLDPPEDPNPFGFEWVHEHEICIVYCYECREVLGPALSETVGYELATEHLGHLTKIVDEWTELEH